MTIHEAIQAIVTLGTLPPQIDYTLPYQYKAEQAQKRIDRLPADLRAQVNDQIRKQINEYHDSGAAYYDSLF